MAREFSIDYTETYRKNYTVEAESFEEATKKLLEDIMEGRESGSEECIDSDFEDTTDYDPKLVALTDTELSLVSDCILAMLNNIDRIFEHVYNIAAINAISESREKYYNLLLQINKYRK